MKRNLILTSMTCALALATSTLCAEEGATGHYMPGSAASFIDAFTGDSGTYALLGDFEGRTVGVGPVLSYVRPFNHGKSQFLAELKWLPELDVNNRMKGDYVWFKFGFLLYALAPCDTLWVWSLSDPMGTIPTQTTQTEDHERTKP